MNKMNPPEYDNKEFQELAEIKINEHLGTISFHFITNRKYANQAISRVLEDVDRSLFKAKINVKSANHSVEVELTIVVGIGLMGIAATKKFTDLLMTDLYMILKNKIFAKTEE